MTRWSLGRYDCVLAVSRRIAAELSLCFPRSCIAWQASPIDLQRFVTRGKAEARALLGYPNCDEKWILFNALRLDDPIKRYSLARKAFDLANARLGNLRLRIVNDFPHDMVPLFVAACDLILCTSETEGWPNSVKEALACNVPFVSTDVSDLRDIAKREPKCRICRPDARVIADNICDVLSSVERPNLRQYVLEMGVDASSDRLIRIYNALVAS
jgi:hypothetical protein